MAFSVVASTSTSGVNLLVAAVTVPSGAMVALTPLVVAMTEVRSCSTERTWDIAICW